MKQRPRGMGRLLLGLLVLATVGALVACGGVKPQVKAIQDRGVLRVGVMVDVPRFSDYDEDGALEGLEIDLAKLIAEEMLGDAEAIAFTATTAQMRGPMLENNEVDIVVAAYTITEERKKSLNFTVPYYVDEIGFLVRKGAGIDDITDLDGRTVGVAKTSTARDALDAECAVNGTAVDYLEYASFPEVKAALLDGQVDAFVVDKSILLGYVDSETELLDYGFDPQPYGVATKLENGQLAEYLNGVIEEIQEDGRLEALMDRWLS